MPTVAISAVPIVAIVSFADDVVPVRGSIDVDVLVDVNVSVHVDVFVYVDALVDANVFVGVTVLVGRFRES
jgi:hypothetical protein